MEHYKQMFLTIGSAALSISHFIIAAETRSIIAWVIGCVAGIYAIYASHVSAKASNLKIKREMEIEQMKAKNK